MKQYLKKILGNNREPVGAWGRFWAHGMNVGHMMMARWGLAQIPWKTDWNVLDIGCGGGANLARILHRCPAGKVYGVDISTESVAISSKKNAKELGKRCFIEVGAADALPYESSMMDAVTAFETIYFWPDIRKGFAEVARVLRPGGLFAVIVDSSNPENKSWTEYIEGMRIYTPKEIETLMKEAGLKDVTVRTTHSERVCVIGKK